MVERVGNHSRGLSFVLGPIGNSTSMIAATANSRRRSWADAAFVAASHRFDETGTVEADTAAKKAVAAFAAARLTLARTVPTTPAGLAAIMGFVSSSNSRVRAHLLRRRRTRRFHLFRGIGSTSLGERVRKARLVLPIGSFRAPCR